jgi:hypothetical protein
LTHARIKTSKEIDRHRRRFFGGAALTLESRKRGGMRAEMVPLPHKR